MKKKKIDFKTFFPENIKEVFFPEVITNEILIIKSHLLIEYALEYFLNTVSKNKYELEGYDFSFYDKLKISLLFGLEENDPGNEVRVFIEQLNKIRNQIAHNIEFNHELLNEICNTKENYNESKYKSLDLFYQFMLVGKSCWMAARIASIGEQIKLSSIR